MADAEVNDAIRSAVGASPIVDPQKGTSPLDIIGNIPSDIKNIVIGFPSGVLNYAETLPGAMSDFLHMNTPAMQAKYHMETGDKISALWQDPAGLLRDLSREPVFGQLVPGLQTAAALTTSQGRKSLEQHPVSTAIDVGSALAAAGKLGVFGKGAEAAGAEERLAAATEGTDAAVPKPSALEALQAGNPYKAAGRGFLSAVENFPGSNITRTSIKNVLTDLNIHPDLVAKLARPYQVIKGTLDREMNAFVRSNIIKPILDLKILDRKNGTDLHGTFNRVMRGETALTDEEIQMLRSSSDPVTGQAFVTPDGTLSDAAKEIATNPDIAQNVDPAMLDAIQKVMDNEAWTNSPMLQAIGVRARRWMDQQARDNPNLVGVRGKMGQYAAGEAKSPWQAYGEEYFYHKAHPVAKKFNAQLDAFNHLDAMAAKLEKANQAHLSLNTEQSRADFVAAADEFHQAEADAAKAKGDFQQTFAEQAPASMYDILAENARGRAVSYAQSAPQRLAALRDQLKEAERQGNSQRAAEIKAEIVRQTPNFPLETAIARIQGSFSMHMLEQAIGPDAAKQIMQETELTWRSLAQHGVDPIFLPNVKDSRREYIRFPTVIPEAPKATAHSSKNTMFNLSRSVNDVSVGLIELKRQQLTEAGTAEFAQRWVSQWVRLETDSANEIQDAIRNGGPMTADIRTISKAEMGRHYKVWDPESQGFSTWFPKREGIQYVMPLGVERAIKYLSFDEKHGPWQMKYDQVMKVWRFSVLTTPRHISHILLGGAMMGQLRDPLFIPHFIQNFKQARGILEGDNYHLLAQFGGNANDFTPEQLYAIGSGKSMGRIMMEVSKRFRQLNTFEENATMMYKITTMLAKEKSGVEHEEAIALANKMFIDMNALSPLERVVMRKIFPFYGFTRHLFRYLMTYPADHPYAASILINFARQQETDNKTGLPRDMSLMFYLGEPDINGNVKAVDYRSVDPFRSFYNLFTLGGWAAQTNPAVQLGLEQLGVNVLSGTPELYPNTHYDPSTGTLVADQPSNLGLRIMESILPETAAIDAKFQLSDQFKNLKVSDPAAFQHRVYTALGIPFGLETINIPLKEQAAQLKRYRDAQTQINKAVQTGDFSSAKRYSYVPVPSLLSPWIPGTYATPQQIEAVYRALQQRVGTDVSLHAVLPKPTRKRTG